MLQIMTMAMIEKDDKKYDGDDIHLVEEEEGGGRAVLGKDAVC